MTLTLEQFNKIATKEDLRNLENRMASKEDLNKLADRTDKVVIKLIATSENLDRVENKVDVLTENISTLLTSVDGLAKKLDDIEHAFVSNQAAHDRFEGRLERIEKHLNLNPLFSR